jgi:hypothetical protein
MATGAEAPCQSAALVAGPFAGRLRKNGFEKKAMLEALGAFTSWDDTELFDSTQADAGEQAQADGEVRVFRVKLIGHRAARQFIETGDLASHVAARAS